jgi:hypothetical protein
MEVDPAQIWYHGSPLELTTLHEGSTITQKRELARIFSHKPTRVSVSYHPFQPCSSERLFGHHVFCGADRGPSKSCRSNYCDEWRLLLAAGSMNIGSGGRFPITIQALWKCRTSCRVGDLWRPKHGLHPIRLIAARIQKQRRCRGLSCTEQCVANPPAVTINTAN